MVVTDRWPLVGREAELRLVAASRPGAVIAGEAGVGRSRLLDEALDGLARTGCTIRRVTATTATRAVPLGAAAHLLPADLPGAPRGVLRDAASALAAGNGGPVVVAVDDAHLLDDVSAALVQHLVQARAATVVLTVRSGEPAPDAVVALWKDQLLARVELPALSEARVDELLTRVLGARCDATTLRRLHRNTAGDVALLQGLVRAGLASGALARTAGVWVWSGPWDVPPELGELVTRRIGRLDPDERDVLEAAAFGEPLELDLLARLGPGAALDRLVGRNLLRLENSGRRTRVRLAHPLYGEMLRSRCDSSTGNRWRLALADAVEATGAHRDGDALRVARWRLDAGASCPSEALLSAARQACAARDLPLAERLAWAAAGAGDRIGAAHVLWRAAADPARAADVESLQAALLSDPRLPAAERATLTCENAFLTFHALGRAEDAVSGLRDAARALGDGAARRELRALEGLFALFTLDLAGSAAILRPLVGDSGRAGVQAVIGLAAGLACAGRFDDAIGLLARGREAGVAAELPGLDVVAEAFEGHALLLSGRVPEAARTLARRADDEDHAHLTAACAQAERMQGRVGPALRRLRDGEARYRRSRGAMDGPVLLAELAATRALAADPVGARAALDEADRGTGPFRRLLGCRLESARSWVVFAEGDRTAAVDLAERAAEQLRAAGAFGFEQLARYDLVRWGAPERAVDRLEELADVVQGRLVTVLAAHARAAASRDGAALDRVAGEFAGLGATLFAAEAAAHAAAAHRQAGAETAHRRSAGRAARLAAGCPGACISGLAALDVPALTPRERGVAELAAGGLPSAVIADRLTLSTRTVDNHLHRVYAKLGIRGRHELACAL
jgi:DNA-binding NarL/FixJ family response regulator